MNEITKEIFEKYEVRKSFSQKSAFIDYTLGKTREMGYSATVESKKGKSPRNIVVGSPESAKVIFTAHYDTCPSLPFPNLITPRSPLLYILYQLLVVTFIIGVPFLISFGVKALLILLGVAPEYAELVRSVIYLVGLIALMLLIMIGPANPHTANDNTSGVTVLFDIMRELPEELRGSVAFVFFDLEEVGLLGSSFFASKRKGKLDLIPVVNFDCISDGDTILFALRKGATDCADTLSRAFPHRGAFTVDIASKGVVYPSDQANFKKGIGVAALKKTRRGLLYMNKIHTPKDIEYCEANVEFLKEGSIRLARILASEK